MENENPKGIKVEMIRLVNQLKRKMGGRYINQQEEGFLPEEMINQADELIESLCGDCQARINALLKDLNALWEDMKKTGDEATRKEMATQVFTLSHEVKDISAMCGFFLLSHFAESLRDYIGKTTLTTKAQEIIVQAHLDAMNVVSIKSIREDVGPEAEELKRMVKKAVDQYS